MVLKNENSDQELIDFNYLVAKFSTVPVFVDIKNCNTYAEVIVHRNVGTTAFFSADPGEFNWLKKRAIKQLEKSGHTTYVIPYGKVKKL